MSWPSWTGAIFVAQCRPDCQARQAFTSYFRNNDNDDDHHNHHHHHHIDDNNNNNNNNKPKQQQLLLPLNFFKRIRNDYKTYNKV